MVKFQQEQYYVFCSLQHNSCNDRLKAYICLSMGKGCIGVDGLRTRSICITPTVVDTAKHTHSIQTQLQLHTASSSLQCNGQDTELCVPAAATMMAPSGLKLSALTTCPRACMPTQQQI